MEMVEEKDEVEDAEEDTVAAVSIQDSVGEVKIKARKVRKLNRTSRN